MSDSSSDQTGAEKKTEQMIGMVMLVDLVTMAEKDTFTLYRNYGGGAMNLGLQPLGKERAEMEIVITFKVDQSAAMGNQPLQGIQNGIKLSERMRREAEPEIKKIPHYVEGIDLSLKFMEKAEQMPVIVIIGRCQVGIS